MSMSQKYLIMEKKVTSSQIKDAIEQGSMAFWATVADIIPQAETNDVDTATERELLKAMTKAVNAWVKYNIMGK
jgi:hypothetical protein